MLLTNKCLLQYNKSSWLIISICAERFFWWHHQSNSPKLSVFLLQMTQSWIGLLYDLSVTLPPSHGQRSSLGATVNSEINSEQTRPHMAVPPSTRVQSTVYLPGWKATAPRRNQSDEWCEPPRVGHVHFGHNCWEITLEQADVKACQALKMYYVLGTIRNRRRYNFPPNFGIDKLM